MTFRVTSTSVVSAPPPTSQVPRLRRIARLVHCLQKERGASCALCALPPSSHPSTPPRRNRPNPRREHLRSDGGRGAGGCVAAPPTPESVLLRDSVAWARRGADAALELLAREGGGGNDEVVRSGRESLSRIRAAVDAASASRKIGGGGTASDPLRRPCAPSGGFPVLGVLVDFNALIATITNDSMELQCEALRRSESLPPGGLSRHKSLPPGLAGRRGKVASIAARRAPDRQLAGQEGGDDDIRSNVAAKDSNSQAGTTRSPILGSVLLKESSSGADAERAMASSLLSLWLAFVRLKESTCAQRAVLSSLMAMGESVPGDCFGDPSDCTDSFQGGNNEPGKPVQPLALLFSGLVLEEENRRRIARELQRQARHGSRNGMGAVRDAERYADAYRSLLALVDRAVRPAPEMEDLHNAVRVDFELKQLRKTMTLDKFWGKISAYIDRLHSLELLILEELESSLAIMDKDTTPATAEPGLAAQRLAPLDTPDAHCDEKTLDCTMRMENTRPVNFSALLQALTSHGTSKDDAMKALVAMPLEELKDSLLTLLGTANNDTAVTETDREQAPTPPAQDATEAKPAPDSPKSAMSLPNDLFSGALSLPAPIASDPLGGEWAIDPYEIEFRKRIGHGVAGTTYLAHWSGQRVAVKVAAITDMGLEGWSTEVRSLRRLHHPNIIRFLGSIFNPSPRTYGLVLEYCDAGDLSAALSRWTPPGFFWRVAGDMANGMAYLHGQGLLHRDIKPHNVLLHGNVAGGDFVVKLTDFGVAKKAYDESNKEHTAETGTFRWMAPEVIRHEPYSLAADVFSYALVMWQLLTREEPFCNVSQIEAAGLIALEQSRPPFPTGTPKEVEMLIDRCWDECPGERLSFGCIKTELRDMRNAMSDQDMSFLDAGFGHQVYEAPESVYAEWGGSQGGKSRGSERLWETRMRSHSFTSLRWMSSPESDKESKVETREKPPGVKLSTKIRGRALGFFGKKKYHTKQRRVLGLQ